jgi:hypothetical protein
MTVTAMVAVGTMVVAMMVTVATTVTVRTAAFVGRTSLRRMMTARDDTRIQTTLVSVIPWTVAMTVSAPTFVAGLPLRRTGITGVHRIEVSRTRIGETNIRGALVGAEAWTATLDIALTLCAPTMVALRRLDLARIDQIRIHKTGIDENRLGSFLSDEVGERLRGIL